MCNILELADRIKKEKGLLNSWVDDVKDSVEKSLNRNNSIWNTMLQIINFIENNENNEDKVTLDIIYQDLEKEFNEIINFIKNNEDKIK